MTATIEYYNQNAEQYAGDTIDVEFAATQNQFLRLLPKGAAILDFGCGSGRDTKLFLERGYYVDALDGSIELCKIASRNTGIEVRQCLFEEFEAEEAYDGIWACSSILHLPKRDLKTVIEKLLRALKPGGYIYTSFKYGEFEGVRNGRYFTHFTEDTFQVFIKKVEDLEIVDLWISEDVRPGRHDEKWLNLILRKEKVVER